MDIFLLVLGALCLIAGVWAPKFIFWDWPWMEKNKDYGQPAMRVLYVLAGVCLVACGFAKSWL